MIWMDAYHDWRGRLAEALDGRYYSGEWLDHQVMSGRAMFLPGVDCALVAEVRYYPTGAKDLAVICAAGSVAELISIVPALEAIGAECGCLAVLVDSREAWARLLKPLEFVPYKVAVRKAL